MTAGVRSLFVVMTRDAEMSAAVESLAVVKGSKSHVVTGRERLTDVFTADHNLAFIDLATVDMDVIAILKEIAYEHDQCEVVLVDVLGSYALSAMSELAVLFGVNLIASITKPLAPIALTATDLPRVVLSQRDSSKTELDVNGRSKWVAHYQPIVELDANVVVAWEALLRTEDKEASRTAPSDILLKRHQDADLQREIFEFMSRTAVRDIAERLRINGRSVGIAINISSTTLRDLDIQESLLLLVERWGITVGQVTLELIEDSPLTGDKRILECLLRLRASGFQLAIDDFGTGFSSPSYLLQIPVTAIKIDRRFIRGVERNSANKTLVERFIGMAADLGVGVVAEGIENEDQLATLRSLGCLLGQGFYFSPPLSVQDIRRKLLDLW